MPTIRSLLHGPPPPLPRPIDGAWEGWARLPPRVRLLACVLALVVLGVQCGAWRDDLRAEWGGPAVPVLQARRDVAAGEAPGDSLVVRVLPAQAVPRGALEQVEEHVRLVLPLQEGAVLTRAHVSPAGIASHLPSDQRAVAVPLDEGLGVQPGALVDLWSLDSSRGSPELLAGGRLVLALTAQRGRPTALVSLPSDLVATAAAALSAGRLAVALAPGAPQGD